MKGTQCSDWHRGWGLGNTHLGRLYHIKDNIYQWVGTRQGRHNNILQRGMKITFDLLPDNSFEFHPDNKTNWLPDRRDVMEAIRILNKPEPIKQVRQPRIKSHLTQYKLAI
jgi:hypothetical protein